MLGQEAAFLSYLGALALSSAVISGGLTWAVALRYGRRKAWVVPIAVLIAAGAVLVRVRGAESFAAPGTLALVIGLSTPPLAGALLGLMLHRRQ